VVPREPGHDVRLRAAGADVLGPGEALAEEAVHLRRHLAHTAPVPHGDVAQRSCHEEDREHGEDRQREAGAQILARDDDKHADKQEEVAEDVHREAREERGERGHVAVDALDQLASRPRLVEGKVELEAVEREIRAQRVRRGPAQ
jgi:hypothetical protein